MNTIEVLKALSNEHRLQMLQWLKNPYGHFAAERLNNQEMLQASGEAFDGWVCVGMITEKSGLAQSVVSGYLSTLKQAGLIESRRVGKWTYYRYLPQGVAGLIEALQKNL
ncbi:transcriptional regulator [Neisseria dentiae]|uniref:Transcriptional regulator n=1 Tax=Neisseria dentiae TaxID=194197 RepID=A0A1X3DFM1_9NEIS|nr:metalloregulator ArsR/SmtB family transcription factor [Neisseria dentiae]OSI18606.1 transcriptional regulator [Neisseria dentiae]QMT45502.1 helix-turn-helix transcriptional regulator [Neisseria dentiae]STZ51386.1 DNA-binding transcriptional repressor ArsR [Neisseria dentiae]